MRREPYMLLVWLLAGVTMLGAEAKKEGTFAKLLYPIWPIPREARFSDDRLLLTNAVIVVPEGNQKTQFPGRLLANLIADQFHVAIPVAVGTAPERRTPIFVGEVTAKLMVPPDSPAISASSPGPEGYVLRVSDQGAWITGCDYRGTLYGVSSFILLVHQWGHESIAVWQATIRDWPFLPIRWVHVYIPGKDEMPFAHRYLRDFLLRYKFNGLILEVGGGMRLDSHPEISVGWWRTVSEWYAHGETIFKLKEGIPLGTANRFAASCHFGVGGGSYIEKDDLRHFADWAEQYGLEIVPEIQSLSHSYYIASAHRELAEDPDMPWPDSYCPSNPESYKVLFDIMDEYIDLLHPKRVHIGHDEWRAGAFCPRCKGKDAGELYAQDVLKIHRHLKDRGIETWMWGDHYVDGHNRFGGKNSEGGVVRYEYPDTRKARDIVAAATSEIHITNWSGFAGGDETFKTLGWKFIIGNFAGGSEKDWPARAQRSDLLGGEVSSWCALEEFQLGKLNIPQATYTINLMWSKQYPARNEALEQVNLLMPQTRRLLAAVPPPSLRATPMRFDVLDILSALNHPLKGSNWDLTGLKPGEGYYNGIPFLIADPEKFAGRGCVLVARRPGDLPTEAELPVSGQWASLLFIQSTTERGRESIHAGDATHFPHESSELLGLYEIRFADGLVSSHEIRYEETVSRWNAGFEPMSYFARALLAGMIPENRKAVLWASEWTNPRPDVPIVSVKMVGSPGPSNALPILIGITGVEKPRVEDYR
ncbi:MAG TPA: glycoside hydrolase family 20 zincin-like fold domain-containing protein [Terriglobia bacterium]|nr:glycoside hydrolase family 20 zincin-like fold domain-containing protein [Terriglobia bacterium]